MVKRKDLLRRIYKVLYRQFGPQNWWPGQTSFEVMVGAVLTQNTNWQNVQKALGNIKRKRLLCAKKLYNLSVKELASLIRPAGYYNIKAERLKNFLTFMAKGYNFSIAKMKKENLPSLREKLLSVKGIGQETADSMLLYALNKPIFVVDAYTRRILLRHGLIGADFTYEDIQNLFMETLPLDVEMFNEYHALLVKLGKEYCKKEKGRCKECPLAELN